MTAPNEPTEVIDPNAGASGAGGDGTKTGEGAKEWKLEDLPAEAQAFIRARVADAEAKARTTSKANAATEERARLIKEFSGILGLEPDNTDPKVLAEQLSKAQADKVSAQRERDLVRIAGRASVGGDADALIDSTSFMSKLHQLDPTSSTYTADLEALVVSEIAANPRFKAAGAGAPAAAHGAGGDFTGSNGSSSSGGPRVEELGVAELRKLLYPTK